MVRERIGAVMWGVACAGLAACGAGDARTTSDGDATDAPMADEVGPDATVPSGPDGQGAPDSAPLRTDVRAAGDAPAAAADAPLSVADSRPIGDVPAIQPDTSPGTQPDTSPDTSPDVAPDLAPDIAPVACQSAAGCPLPPPCQQSLCSAAGACTTQPLADGAKCSDQDACTTQDTCLAGACEGGPAKDCDDGNACTVDTCKPAGGCIHLAAAPSTACDDGDPCSVDDSCVGGACTAGLNTCQCKASSDCLKLEDGDTCNGTLYCDKTAAPYLCKVNPATTVTCSAKNDGPCQKNTCLAATGECKLLLAPKKTPCDDGEPCTSGDVCETGVCLGGTNVCACQADADCDKWEDGDKCNGTLYCDLAKGKCLLNPVTVVQCQSVDDTGCRKNLCNPKTGKCLLVPIAEGKSCDDGSACTPNEACQQGVCKAQANTCECEADADCAPKNPKDKCKGALYCDLKSHQCVLNPASVVKCQGQDDTACLVSRCAAATGQCAMTGLPQDGTACNDGNPCTQGETCGGGVCKAAAKANTCQCADDGDCLAKEDGDPCNGTLYCDKSKGSCEVNPATVVQCPTTFDTPCEAFRCKAATGKCAMTPVHQGNQCDDDVACSSGGWCNLGSCEAEGSACQCTSNADCGKFEDGDLCNGTLYCDKTTKIATCKPNLASVVVCPTTADTVCSKASCSKASGKCAPAPTAGTCDDGNACTLADGCVAGLCTGLPKPCDDGDKCTVDACVAPVGCSALPLAATACDDGSPCTDGGCDKLAGCKQAYNTAPCSDGDACTAGDACGGGTCAGKLSACDDGNACTDDTCDKAKGCGALPNTMACSDGNACSVADSCKGGACAPGVALGCDDKNVCTQDGCDTKKGCVTVAAAGSCDDGDGCTVQDQCQAGGCVGKPKPCDDGNPCTADSCDAKSQACAAPPVAGSCSDGDPCTVGDVCGGSKCEPGKPKLCDDDDKCTQDACVAATGACLAMDVGAKACDDKNPCTDDACHAKLGCSHAGNLAPCEDGNPCSEGDACQNGKCAAGGAKTCDDKGPCTDDACDPAQGCVATFNTVPCDDGVACTPKSACKDGKCAVGAILCDDGNVCTDDACDLLSGSCKTPPTLGDCDDGDKCTTAACVAGLCVAQAAKDCDDNNACTDDHCDQLKGCLHVANTVACDAKVCTALDACKDGACTSSKKPLYFSIDWGTGYNPKDYLYGVATMPDGGAIAVGSTTPGGANKPVVVRFDAAGGVVWTHVAASGNFDGYGIGVAARPDGGAVAVVSSFWGGGGHGYELRFLRFDPAGKVVVETTHKTAAYWHDLPRRIDRVHVSGQDRVLVAAEGHDNFGDNGGYSVVVFEELTGNPVQEHAFLPGNANGAQHAEDILGYGDGDFVVVGWNSGPSSPDASGAGPNALGDRDFSVLHYGQSAPHKREMRFGGKNKDEAYAVERTADGGIVVVGVTYSTGTFNGDILVVRFDAAWNVAWQKVLGGDSLDAAYAMKVRPAGGIVLAGQVNIPFVGPTGSLLELAPNGDLAWQRTGKPMTSNAYLFGVDLRGDGGLFVVGNQSYNDGTLHRTDPWGNSTCKDSGSCVKDGCDDGNACTTGEACTPQSACAGGAAVVCSDGDLCTADKCDAKAASPDKACVYTAYPQGFACAVGKTCQAGACQ